MGTKEPCLMKHFRPKERKLEGVGQVPATQAPQPARCWSRCLHMPLAAGPLVFGGISKEVADIIVLCPLNPTASWLFAVVFW